jgi:hypothetical protein
MILYLFLMCILVNSFPINRMKLGDRLIVIDTEEINKNKLLYEELGYTNEGMDMRFSNITEVNHEELINIDVNIRKLRLLKTLEDNNYPLHNKIELLEINKDICDTGSYGFDILAGGLLDDWI